MNIKYLKVLMTGAILSLSCLVNVANAGLITLNGPSANNVDNPTATLVNLDSFDTGTINDLDLAVHIDGVGYDLSVLLTHVDTGTTATIWLSTDGPGGDLNGGHYFGEVDTVFDDEAALDFHPNYEAVAAPAYRSVDLLSIFDGEQIGGTWQLSIANTGCCEFEGDTLVSWSIMANVTDIPEPSILAIFGLGLMGLASRRVKK